MITETLMSIDVSVLTFFNGSSSLFLDSLVSLLTMGVTWIPLYVALLYLVVKNNETMPQIGLVVGCVVLCVLLCGGVDDAVIKPAVGRLRPCNDPLVKGALQLIGSGPLDCSFFSAHAANTMSIAVFFIMLVRNRLLSWVLLIWSLLNAWTRLYLGYHYPSDVLVGLLYGAAAGGIVYLLFRKLYFKISPRLHYISSQYTRTGYSIVDIDVVIAVVALTIAIAIIVALLQTNKF